MLTPQQVIDSEYLVSRCALLEIAAMFDRYDLAVHRTAEAGQNTEKLECLRNAMALLAKSDVSDNRAEQLLHLFAQV
ncbi:MAG: hypothetical protein ACI9FG_001156 [Crocinitomicaceae bacterium]|jgi:hypothetical protein|uniref:Uncharacterized protein n=1 Tax=Rubritalea profundi TaxID=1658618 RepID=A0A2S7TYJ9_9BACT|nr:hypothetical protein [Rubritalea profundi]PQJ27835.1 hypothetical protein BSZ32_04535 [Rubritalea profundi]